MAERPAPFSSPTDGGRNGGHLALVGPTASGKSRLALELARSNSDFELVSIDSMQVYRGMDIGTAKPTGAEQAVAPHHLIDIVDPDHDFGLAEFQAAAHAVIDDIEQRGKRALLVGGTGLYLQAVTDGFTLPGQFPDVRAELDQEPVTETLHARLAALDPVAAARMEPSNRRRVVRALEVTVGSGKPFSSFGPGIGAYPAIRFRLICLRMDSLVNARRIEQRVDAMFENGLIDEVVQLSQRFELSKTARQALGYKEILDRLEIAGGESELNVIEAADDIKRRTRSFARRQRVWFRRDPRILWLDADDHGNVPFESLEVLVAS